MRAWLCLFPALLLSGCTFGGNTKLTTYPDNERKVKSVGSVFSAGYRRRYLRRRTRKPRKVGEKLKIVTFNVNYGGSPWLASKVLLRSKADIIALQETTPYWERILRRSMSKRYKYIRFKHCCGAGGLAFLSRFPMVKSKYMYPAKRNGWFPSWFVEFRTRKGKIGLLNVHLRPPLSGGGGLSSIPAAYFKTRSIRLRDMKSYIKRIRSNGPMLVLGDFNESDSGTTLRWLRKKNKMRSALYKFDRSTPTWSWPTSSCTAVEIPPRMRAGSPG